MDVLIRTILSPLRSGCRLGLYISKRHASCSTKSMQFKPDSQKSTQNVDHLKRYGQPTYLSHPHRILEGEIMPGMRVEEFQARRNRLLESIEKLIFHEDLHKKSNIVIIPSSCKKYMTEKIPYLFRQNSDFLYLTGCMEPNSTLVMSTHGAGNHESILFLRGRDPQSELWDGPRTGIDEAHDFFGVDKVLPNSELDLFISRFLKENKGSRLWYDYINDVNSNVHITMKEFLSSSWSTIWESPTPLIHRLRLFKSPAEQELMKESCRICSQAIKSTIMSSKPGDNEAHIFARVDYGCRMNGAEYLAYPPVVAGGERANTIHYINNDQIVKDGELVLMDAGCEYHGYSSDITRTWPISGKFTPKQRALYDVVYSVQTELIQLCNTFPSLDQLFNTMCKLLGARLIDLGVVSRNTVMSENISPIAYSFCPHHVSHYLGMDVHDTGSVPRNIRIEPGMIITIEPGVYVSPSNKYANPDYYNLGIRIEDDILITNNGPLVLTSSCPKHPDDLEKILQGS